MAHYSLGLSPPCPLSMDLSSHLTKSRTDPIPDLGKKLAQSVSGKLARAAGEGLPRIG